MIVHNKKRKKILWQIFPSFLIITVISLTAVTWYATAFFKSFSLQNTEKELTILAKTIHRELHNNPPADMDLYCKEIGDLTQSRVTVVLPSGDVIGDSWADISAMENHKHRYEVAQALTFGKGVKIRYSATLQQNMMYVALRVETDEKTRRKTEEVKWVVRVSVSIASIEKEILHIQKNIALALIIALAAAAGASLFVARRITRPIELMKTGAQQYAQGNLKARLIIPDSKELFQLALTMNQMAESLDEKIKTIENRSMELEAIYASMKEGVIAVDLNENIIMANHAATAIFNYDPSQIKGRNVIEVSRHYELQQYIAKTLSHPEPVEEDIIIQKEEDFIYNARSTALQDMDGERLGTLIIFHDITRIRHLEQMHIDFAANVSHELKTPLTSIKGFVETLEELLDGPDAVNERRFIRIISKNVNRLIALIDDLLALSRLERKEGIKPNLEICEVGQVIASALDTCAPLFEANEIGIRSDCAFRMAAKLDPILMEQALVNLIENAVKYSSTGDCIIVRCREKRKKISIEIEDSGAGIPKEHLKKIFRRFYRVDKGRSREVGGTGLGLAIVKHIVKYHQGWVSVTSTLGKGSTFKVVLPKAKLEENANVDLQLGDENGNRNLKSNSQTNIIQINSVPIN